MRYRARTPLRFVAPDGRRSIDVVQPTRHSEDGDVEYLDGWDVVTQPGRAKRHRRREQAIAALHETIAAWQAEGARLEIDGLAVGGPPSADDRFVSLPELEREVETDPANEDAALVLADAWSQAGDPRGDCLLLARALQAVTDPSEFVRNKKASEAARARRDRHVFGALGRDAYRVRAAFRRNLVDRIELRDELVVTGRPTDELLAAGLANPFARFCDELFVEDARLDAVTAALARARPTALRTLYVRDLDEQHAPRGASLDVAALDVLPRLERLWIQANVRWGDARLSALRTLHLHARLSADELAHLLAWASAHPRLEEIEIWSNTPTVAGPDAIAVAASWVGDAAKVPPTLRRASIDGQTFTR